MIISILGPALSCEWLIESYEKALISTVCIDYSQIVRSLNNN